MLQISALCYSRLPSIVTWHLQSRFGAWCPMISHLRITTHFRVRWKFANWNVLIGGRESIQSSALFLMTLFSVSRHQQNMSIALVPARSFSCIVQSESPRVTGWSLHPLQPSVFLCIPGESPGRVPTLSHPFLSCNAIRSSWPSRQEEGGDERGAKWRHP